MDTEAVKTGVVFLPPVGEDVQFHQLVRLLSGILVAAAERRKSVKTKT